MFSGACVVRLHVDRELFTLSLAEDTSKKMKRNK